MTLPASGLAAKLSMIFQTLIIPIDGGFRVSETDDHWIDVMRLLVNWRVVRTPKDMPWEYDRGYCYYGNGVETLIRAIDGALRWDGADDTDPPGWDKNAITGAYAMRSP